MSQCSKFQAVEHGVYLYKKPILYDLGLTTARDEPVPNTLQDLARKISDVPYAAGSQSAAEGDVIELVNLAEVHEAFLGKTTLPFRHEAKLRRYSRIRFGVQLRSGGEALDNWRRVCEDDEISVLEAVEALKFLIKNYSTSFKRAMSQGILPSLFLPEHP